MVRRNDATPTDGAPDTPGQGGSPGTRATTPTAPSAEAPEGPNLAGFAVVGLTRRRTAAILGTILAVWIVIVFARQVSEASAASGRASEMIAANDARKSDIADLQGELDLSRSAYIAQQARGYGLGGQKEIPFSLDPEAPRSGP